ncbi:Hpt domain-containing protein [Psychrobacter sp. FDAARGOS_221]|uniref:hybrid sensor histidine kinase/response regulator n=1 Tax=Psychrobacter sp. FDAARGOS_221 TaxID=1975705 RepID=UPI000BB590D4|nr:Hpt domain-containing protein [Psychrobacter sp. FDAARGOS_221]PNK60996.1 hypothetical protein A6J60_008950 [Psychrobacter sp. FDAARGOS_221]
MSRSSSPSFTFEWMFPLVKEQLSTLHEQLYTLQNSELDTSQSLATAGDIVEQYQQIHATLALAELSDFASLTQQLVSTLQAVATETLPLSDSAQVLMASELLLQQLSHYVELGRYQQSLIIDSQQQLQALLNNTQTTASQLEELNQTHHQQSEQNQEEQQPDQISEASQQTAPQLKDIAVNQQSSDEQVVQSNVSQQWLQPYLDQLAIPQDADDCDPEIKEIFIEEAEEVLKEIESNLQQLPTLNADQQALSTIRRGFHTLKGSGRMAGALTSAELAWAIENMLNRILEGSIEPTSGMQRLLQEVVTAYPQLMAAFEQQMPYPQQLPVWMAAANLYAKNQHPNFDYTQVVTNGASDSDAQVNEISEPKISAQQPAEIEQSTADDGVLASLANANARLQHAASEVAQHQLQQDLALQQVFVDEATALLDTIESQLNDRQQQSMLAVDDGLVRAFHTLRGAASSQQLHAISDISATVEQSLEQLQQHNQPMSDHHVRMIGQSVALIGHYIQQLQQQHLSAPAQDLHQSQSQLQHQLQYNFDNSVQAEAETKPADTGIHLSVAELIEGIDSLLDAQWQLPQKMSSVETNDTQSQQAECVSAYFEQLLTQSELLLSKVTQSPQFVTVLDALQQMYRAIITQLEKQADVSAQTQHNPNLDKPDKDKSAQQQQAVIDALSTGHEQLLGLFDSLAGSMALRVDQAVIERLQALATEMAQSKVLWFNLAQPSTIELSPNERQPVADTALDDNQPLIEHIETDAELLSIFVEEAQALDEDSHQQFALWRQDPSDDSVIQVLQRHLHTIKGGARMAGIESIAELSHEAETLYEYFANKQIVPTLAWVDLMQSLQDVLSTQIDRLATQGHSFYVPHIVEALKGLASSKQLSAGYQLPAMVLPQQSAQSEAAPVSQADSNVDTDDNSAFQSKHEQDNKAAKGVSSLKMSPANTNSVTTEATQTADAPQIAQTVSAPQGVENKEKAAVVEVAETENISSIELEFDRMKSESWDSAAPDPDILSIFLEEAEEIIDAMPKWQQYISQTQGNDSDKSQSAKTPDQQSDDQLDEQLDTQQQQALAEIQRMLHLLKGGAHMVQADATADVAEALQTTYSKLEQQHLAGSHLSPIAIELLEMAYIWLDQAVYLLKQGINPPKAQALIGQLQRLGHQQQIEALPEVSLQAYVDAITRYQSWRDARLGLRDISDMPPDLTQAVEEEQTSSSSEMIRVPTQLMEQMINLSGESAINRSRIELSMSGVSSTLSEMGTTVQRLAEQLRRMDIELEAQVRSQLDDSYLQADASFDPLEMDQYSAFNQLSKSLAESASDLLDIKTTLYNKTQDTEALLLQLAQTQTQMQQGLMTSRMVPFSRLLPRLQRTVRQTASELGKSVKLSVINEHDEIDRTILERISAPLEHMLRNAVDHGIETPEIRAQQGKSAQGRIVIDITREGSEIVLRLQDDGQGIDVDSVRRKAISRGLIDAKDRLLTDLDIMQYIFHAGLSTASNLTQISGRGVGMDVVLSEVRQLGGSVSAQSEPGQGTTFILRLPLTIAVADALMVRAGGQVFAIPLLQIERIERVAMQRLTEFYDSTLVSTDDSKTEIAKTEQQTNSRKDSLQIAGLDYRLRNLSQLLFGIAPERDSTHSNRSAPVILLKTQTGQNYALHVDEIVGSRVSLVVKPLGRPLSTITGLSAATITADGSVMLILDVLALMRNTSPSLSVATDSVSQVQTATVNDQSETNTETGRQHQTQLHQEQIRQQTPRQAQRVNNNLSSTPKILIVDDSVTVRKVTSRMLARQGYQTYVARDGVEAVELLQNLRPDLMLLDIEMPRMDGFEVAAHVRHQPQLQDLPIIMITSRTGDKHRQRALQLGVNEYMGKPFQEPVLIGSIQRLLGQQVASE